MRVNAGQNSPSAPHTTQMFLQQGQEVNARFENSDDARVRAKQRERFRAARFAALLSHR